MPWWRNGRRAGFSPRKLRVQISSTVLSNARLAELVDALGSGPSVLATWGFDSPIGYDVVQWETMEWIPWSWTRTESQGKYRFAIIPEHPNADSRDRVLEHRAVAENMLGRLLVSGEEVHHVNENKLDNDPGNLEVLTPAEHRRRHFQPEMRSGLCPTCGALVVRAKRQARGVRMFCSRRCSAVAAGPTRDPEHGTYGRYRLGCHCTDCRAANAGRIRDQRNRDGARR